MFVAENAFLSENPHFGKNQFSGKINFEANSSTQHLKKSHFVWKDPVMQDRTNNVEIYNLAGNIPYVGKIQ